MRRLHFSLLFFVAILSLAVLASAKTINVPGDFSTIQAALNAASDGDVIAVAAGSYFENVTVSKSVSIEGANKDNTVIDGSVGRSRQLPTVLIKGTKSVTLKGFTIQGGRRGVQVEESKNVLIDNNKIFRNARQNILVFTNSEATVRNNDISESLPDSNGFAGRGINVVDSQVTILNNTITNNSGYGIAAFSQVGRTLVRTESNKIVGNNYAGILAVDEVQLTMNGDTIEASKAANTSPGHPALPGQGIHAEYFNYLTLNNVTLKNQAGDGIFLDHSILDLNESASTSNGGCGIKFDQVSQVNFGAKTNLEPNTGGSICSALAPLANGSKRSLTFNLSAPGELKALATSPSSTTFSLKLFAPGQNAPLAETSGASPLTLSSVVSAPIAGRWRVEVENTSSSAASVVLSVRQPLFNGSCERVLQDFSLAVVKEPSLPDFNAEECALIYSTMKSLPLVWRSKVAQILRVGRNPDFVGRAQSSFVQLVGEQTRIEFLRTAFHETAHVVHFKLFTPQQFSEWSQLHRAGGNDMENYIGIGTEDPNFLYGQTNEFEDFATVTEEYVTDTIGVLALAKERATKGKPVLLEKIRFLVQLLRDELGATGVYIYRLALRPMPDGSLRAVVQRALAPLDNEGLPAIPAEPEWEDF